MNEFEVAIRLREEGKLVESNEKLKRLAEASPDNALLNYHCAWSFDVLGQEREAIPYYEKAISLGLEGNDLKGAYLGLGSTYRTIGDYAKSKEVLMKGIEVFPQDNSLKTFYTLTLYNLGEHSLAMKILLTIITETSSDTNIKEYTKAIKFYSEDLDKVWD